MEARDAERGARRARRLRIFTATATTVGASAGALAVCMISGSLWWAGAWIAVALVASLAAHQALWNQLAQPLQAAVEAVTRVAEGDPHVRLSPEDLGHFAAFADTLDALCERQRRAESSLTQLVPRLRAIPERVCAAMEEIDGGREATEEAVEETASLLANINASIRGINSEVGSLARSTEESSSAILELQSSADEAARSAASLHDSVDSSTSTIHEISASIRQVAESADAVQGMAEESAAAMVEMDRAIQEVGEHVREASVLTEKVKEGAEEGSDAVAATIQGIEEIRDQTRDAKDVLERLADRIG